MIKRISIDRLKPAYYNPRVSLTIGDKDYERIRKSIENFGYVEPIVWNERTGNIVGGHQRFQVLKDMGETEIEVSVVNLSEKDEKQLNLALNKIKGEWDYNKLEAIFKEFNFDEIEATGFSANEVSLLFEDHTDYDLDDFKWDEPATEYGKSCIVTLKFATFEKAEEWAEENGYAGQLKKGTKTTVIRVE